ncbi:MAG: methylase RsmC, partial [Clostridiales bacterium]|nr:methylase RsmC [Clostridiales bacterium]
KVIYPMFEQSIDHLNEGGQLYIVIQKKQGADSAIKKLTEVYGNCVVIAKDSGYCILLSCKIG